MHHAVILLHILPDGTSHFDWLLDQPDLGIEHRLISFRCEIRPDCAVSSTFCALRLPDHRARYLSYEGVVLPDRGHVERVACGEVLGLEVSSGTISAVIRWADDGVAYRGRHDGSKDGVWNFLCHPMDSALDG